MVPASSKEFLDIRAATECGLTLKCVRDIVRTYNQIENEGIIQIFVNYGI